MASNTFTKSEFVGGKVTVDDNEFIQCRFIKTILVYSGGPAPKFDHCSFENTASAFEGSAGNTIDFLRGTYQSGFRPMIENVIEVIKGKIPEPGSAK